MTNKRREYLAIALIIVLVILSFGAGFLFNDLILERGESLFREDQGDLGIYWEAWGYINENFIGDFPDQQQISYGAVRGSIDTLEDPYTFFVEPDVREKEKERFRGNFGGVGATLLRNEEGFVILTPIPGNPAEAAGILDGDILLAVDERDIGEELTIEEIVELIRGEEGTKVILTVLHLGEDDPVKITITRATILLPSVSYRILAEDPFVGYILLSRFSGESAGEVGKAIKDLKEQGANKLILDLRSNSGGLLNAAVEVSDLFLTGGPIVTQVSKDQEEKIFEATQDAIAGDMPLVILINEASASSSEIVAGALHDRDRATLIGQKSFGKGSVQQVYDLSDGSSIHVTASRWFTPNGKMIDQNGLEPDLLAEQTQEAIDNGRDLVIEEAISFLNSG
ncbi:MAG: S41 family peptidase [Anaerolineae bacterium]|nr:MAG: S41 family peptidase [Anaerolineae bacterium]